MKLDKPTLISTATFATAILGVVAAELSGAMTPAQAIEKAAPIVMAYLVALGIVSHGTPAESAAPLPTKDAPAAAPKDGES
jgi:hypothetical protein